MLVTEWPAPRPVPVPVTFLGCGVSTDQTFATSEDISMETLTARMPNPAVIIPEAMRPIRVLFESISGGGVPQATLDLVHLRVSQVNGCSPCVDGGWRKAKKAGETDGGLFTVAARGWGPH